MLGASFVPNLLCCAVLGDDQVEFMHHSRAFHRAYEKTAKAREVHETDLEIEKASGTEDRVFNKVSCSFFLFTYRLVLIKALLLETNYCHLDCLLLLLLPFFAQNVEQRNIENFKKRFCRSGIVQLFTFIRWN